MSRTLRIIPRHPSAQLRYHIELYLWGFLMTIHMKQGYAKVIGSAIPPINPARLCKNGSATAMKNARPPKKIRNPVLSHQGHGPSLLLVYLNSRLSKTGMAYIWKEVRLLTTTNRLVSPRITFEVSCLWYLYKALSIPPFAGIWYNSIR
ncbi:hypothetical protein LguiA_006923 [Lonicera macranthoides]